MITWLYPLHHPSNKQANSHPRVTKQVTHHISRLSWVLNYIFLAATISLSGCAKMTTISPPTLPSPQVTHPSPQSHEVAFLALSLVDTPYRWGGNTPESGFDCSGFIRYVFQKSVLMTLPRSTEEMSKQGLVIQIQQPQSGDLVFFNTSGHPHSHAGIYIGENRFIHAPRAGGQIRLDDLSTPYWQKRLDGIRRVIKTTASTG